jgi:hypothetical protein
MNQPVRLAVASLLLALTSGAAFGATNSNAASGSASDRDIGKAMSPLPTGAQTGLNLDLGDAAKNPAGKDRPEPLSPRCRQLRADIDRARQAPPEPPRDTYPEGPRRDGRRAAPMPPPSSMPGLQVQSSNSVQGRPSGDIEYSRRAKAEQQFQRECQ